MDRDELRVKLTGLEEAKALAERELANIRGRAEQLKVLERERDETMASLESMTRERLDRTTPERRHRLYGALGIRVEADAERSITVSGNVVVPDFPFDTEPSHTSSPS
jgi:hypothetical protein